MAAKLANRVWFNTATTGTGTVAVGSAVSKYRTPASDSSLTDGDTVSYVIEDGTAWEKGTGVLGSTKTTMTRVLDESSTGSLLSLTGSAAVMLTPGRQELDNFAKLDTANTFAAMQTVSGTSNGRISLNPGDTTHT